MSDLFVNKVAESGIISLDLADYYPKGKVLVFDLKEYLFMELILKEKDFRAALTTIEWENYRNAHVAITCSADAIIPVWAYMLVASWLQPIACDVVFGDEKKLVNTLLLKNIEKMNPAAFTDMRIVIKGCGDIEIPEAAYVTITSMLRPFVKSIMYGEPCSTVPIYKKPRNQKEDSSDTQKG